MIYDLLILFLFSFIHLFIVYYYINGILARFVEFYIIVCDSYALHKINFLYFAHFFFVVYFLYFTIFLTFAIRIILFVCCFLYCFYSLRFGITYKQISYYSYNLLASVNFNARPLTTLQTN